MMNQLHTYELGPAPSEDVQCLYRKTYFLLLWMDKMFICQLITHATKIHLFPASIIQIMCVAYSMSCHLTGFDVLVTGH